MAGLSQEEAKVLAEEAATKALANFFKYFDVDVDNPDSLKNFRQDLQYLSNTRKGAEEAKRLIRNAIVPGAILSLAVMIFTIFKDGLREALVSWLVR